MNPWFEDEDFWAALYPHFFIGAKREQAEAEVDKLLALSAFRGESVLDLCCGEGRHAVPLAKRGARVTAVDRTPFLLAKGEERSRGEDAQVEWVLADAREFVRAGAYELCLNMWTSFGYFDDPAEDMKVLENVHASLKAGGVFLIELLGKECLARTYQPTTSEILADGTLLVRRQEIFADWTRMKIEWIFIRDGSARSLRFHHAVYSGLKLSDRLKQCGFRSVKLYGNLEGDEYGLDATRLVAVARKS